MKKAVIFYSRDGNTKEVARYIAEFFSSDIVELIDKKERSGFIGSVFAGMDAVLGRSTRIEFGNLDVSRYDLIFLGTPVWAWSMAPAVRAFISQTALIGKRLCLFCTMDSNGAEKTFLQIARLLPAVDIVGKVSIKKDMIRTGEYKKFLDDFLGKLHLGEQRI